MSSTPSSTMPPPDVPTSQGEQRVRPVQKLLLIILITACIVLVGGVALLCYLSKSKDAGTQVASKFTPSCGRIDSRVLSTLCRSVDAVPGSCQSVPVDYKCGPRSGVVLHQLVPTFSYTVAIPGCR
jgi:hypothetical protein